ncbi:UNVERIFIED_CONTAM: hypothetical protein FKN15_073789 [Acipenser sinensis]
MTSSCVTKPGSYMLREKERLTPPEGVVAFCFSVFQEVINRGSSTYTYPCSWLTPPERAHLYLPVFLVHSTRGSLLLRACVPGSIHQREPHLYLPVFLAHSTRGSLPSAYLRSWHTPPEEAQLLLICVPGLLHQREPNLGLPVFLAHSTRGSPTSTYLCFWLTPPEGAQPRLTCIPGSLHQREPNLNFPVVQIWDFYRQSLSQSGRLKVA